MKRVWLFGVIIVAVASGFALHNLLPSTLTQAQSQTEAPRRDVGQPQPAHQPVPDTRKWIAARGRLEPQSETIDIGAPSDDRLDQLLVSEGHQVEAGSTLAYLESYAERLAEKNYAQGRLQDAKTRLVAEKTYGETSITEAGIRIEQAETLERLDIRVQEAKVRQLEADLAGAQQDLARFQGLRNKGTIAQQDLDHQHLLVRRTQEELNSTRALLVKLQAAYELNLRMAQAQLQTARASATRAQAAIEIQTLRRYLELTQARLDRSIIRAPFKGTILQIFTRPGEATGIQPILTMGSTEQMYAVAEVYETDIRFVRVGQPATVTSPALPKALTGTVVHIGRVIAKNDILDVDPTADTDARVVEVKIQLDRSDTAARLIHLQVHVQIALLPHTNESDERAEFLRRTPAR